MAIVINDDEASVDGAKEPVPSFASVVAESQTTAVFDAVADIETRSRRMIEPLLPVLDALSATWTPPAITLPPEYFEASSALQAQLTAPLAGLQADIASMVGASSSTQSLSVVSGMLETLRLVADTVAFPTIDYGITMPDMSWLTDAVLPTFTVSDISRRMNIVPSIVSVTSSPGRERAPISPDSAVDAWLSSIRSDLPSKRAGMWWALRHSPDAVCHSATSAIELFDHVLYELAPDLEVIAISQDHSEPELFIRDTRFGPQPTWSGRARVAVMVLGGDATAQEFAASFVDVRGQLVKMKHKSHLHGLGVAESALERLDLLLRQLAVYG